MSKLKTCKNCRKNNEPIMHGYIGWLKDECYECPICRGQLDDVCISIDEYKIIDTISDDVDFLEAMIKLKEDNIIEYQSRMSQFKGQLASQQTQSKSQQDNTPKCPHCSSTNIKSLSGLDRGMSIAMLGIFSKKINKSFECCNCKYTW